MQQLPKSLIKCSPARGSEKDSIAAGVLLDFSLEKHDAHYLNLLDCELNILKDTPGVGSTPQTPAFFSLQNKHESGEMPQIRHQLRERGSDQLLSVYL